VFVLVFFAFVLYQQQFGATPAVPAAPRLVLCACITYGFPQLLLLCLLR
jgi:hypothetical protein